MRKFAAHLIGLLALAVLAQGAWAGVSFGQAKFTKFQYQAVGGIVDLGNDEGSQQLAQLISEFELAQFGGEPFILSIAFNGPGSPQTVILNNVLNTNTCSQNNSGFSNCAYTQQITLKPGTLIAPGTVFGAIGSIAQDTEQNVLATAQSSFVAGVSIPEPETLALLGVAVLAFGVAARRRRR